MTCADVHAHLLKQTSTKTRAISSMGIFGQRLRCWPNICPMLMSIACQLSDGDLEVDVSDVIDDDAK